MSGNSFRVLIIDGQHGSVAPLIDQLSDKTVEVLFVQDGSHGLKTALTERPDLIVLDLAPEGASGLEVCARLKSDRRTAGIPVIFLSASPATEDKLKGFALGAVDFVDKPFATEEVVARVFLRIETRRHLDRLESMAGQSALDRVGEQAFPEDQMFAQALSVLDRRMAEPPGLVELARELGTNERKLTEIFRRRVGMTVFDYFTEWRLETARHLLERSGMRVQVIAGRVGYRNAGDFTRAFRRRFAVSPREYRQAHRDGAGQSEHRIHESA
jgi:DNA-binding response OmpR family regulator